MLSNENKAKGRKQQLIKDEKRNSPNPFTSGNCSERKCLIFQNQQNTSNSFVSHRLTTVLARTERVKESTELMLMPYGNLQIKTKRNR